MEAISRKHLYRAKMRRLPALARTKGTEEREQMFVDAGKSGFWSSPVEREVQKS